MEQSRLAATATRFYKVLSLAHHNRATTRLFAATPTGLSADPETFSHDRDQEIQPAVPTGRPEEMNEKYEPKRGKRDVESDSEHWTASSAKGTEPLASSRPASASSQGVEHKEVNNPAEPFIQQKRQNSTSTVTLEETSCVGLDGSPWPKEQEKTRSEKVVDDENDYYRHHKASPLSEVEFADTRRPITRATDGTAYSGKSGDIIGWLPEQLDTAEEALERARKIWRENAMRGDPESPHGRVLRVLRGECF